MPSDDILDEIYAAPLDGFTERRNSLAAEAKKAGDPDAAKEIKALKKPSLSAWAVNQLARREPDALADLFEARDRIADAAGAKEMREASEDRKRVLTGLLGHVRGILEGAGHPASSTTIEKVTQTLQSGDEAEERDAILRGHLSQDLVPSGFGGLAGLSFDPAEEAPEDAEAEAAAREEDRSRLQALIQKAEDLEAEADAAEETAVDAERAATQARRAAEKARTKADAARRKANDAADGEG